MLLSPKREKFVTPWMQGLLTFPELRDVVGFEDYYAEEERYKLK